MKLFTLKFCQLVSIVFLLGAMNVQAQSTDTVYAEIAAIDQPFMYNRLGAAQPTGMIFALMSDLVGNTSVAGEARLRGDKRPRPITLRANKGNVVIIKFTNLLTPYDADGIVDAYNTDYPATISQSQAESVYPRTRDAGFHIQGLELAEDIGDQAGYIGANPTSLAAPGETKTYSLIAGEEGVFLIYSTGANIDKNPLIRGAQLSSGLFGSISIQPEQAEWYRSQVTEEALGETIKHWEIPSDDPSLPNTIISNGDITEANKMAGAFPIIDYNTLDDSGVPVLKMYNQVRPNFREIVHTDLTAIITGPNAGRFPYSEDDPSFFNIPASPDRRQPFREFAIHYHEAPYSVQAFPVFYSKDAYGATDDITGTLVAGQDAFAINYGTGGIGAEIYANRIKIGPMADCADCAYEEFFLSSWAVGDPATIVDIPANANTGAGGNLIPDTTLQNQFLNLVDAGSADATLNKEGFDMMKATKVLYPDDPSNVYHSYMNDHVKFRVVHAGEGITHVHHQHAHQWLHSPNSDEGHYMDSQTINPGSGYTLEMVYNGSGNLNKTVGDQIFHCHFYPHFAAGMWSMWRVHDVLELGTELDSDNVPVAGSRALPDGEIAAGTAIPGLVPMPTIGMAPLPGKIKIEEGQIVVVNDSVSPGYPFFIPGVAGSRPPHPPLDFAKGDVYDSTGAVVQTDATLDGGLPRNVILHGEVPFENHTQFDWTKIIDSIQIIELPEEGTEIEKLAMQAHATRTRPSMTPEGRTASFVLNGMPPAQGAPFADPAVDINGNAVGEKRIYKAANIQLDVVLNKKGWHYPQQRIISLWGDVAANINGDKAPEPFFFRANTGEYVEYWHTNLVPEYYELDDYQVRTPTDVIGQHIHLVKFDVTSSDGAANGWNYEDGTLAPDLVRERINAINQGGKHYKYSYSKNSPITNTTNYAVDTDPLEPHYPNPVWGNAPDGQDWRGAQTTIQRWYADPLLNNKGQDRTVRTVFTHDHFGPSTHQQVGLYAGLLVEPNNSQWLDPVTGDTFGIATNGVTRSVNVNGTPMDVADGGPTSWQANIVTANQEESYREFMLEFQDNQQAYYADSRDSLSPYPKYPEDPTTTNLETFNSDVANYKGWTDTANAINAPSAPQLVSTGGKGTYSLNYRSEPIPMRVSNDAGSKRVQSSNKSGDLSYAYSSNIGRIDPAFQSQPASGGSISDSNSFTFPKEALTPGMNANDPFTPLFRAYENDNIQVRTLVGAHVTSHFFNIHGVNWFFEPSNKNSGYRSTQNMGLSEHFEMNFKLPATNSAARDSSFTDYLYSPSADANGVQAGLWGLMRAYDEEQPKLQKLPNNDITEDAPMQNCGCPPNAPVTTYDVSAMSIQDYHQGKTGLTYNQEFGNSDIDAMVFVLNEDISKFKDSLDWEVEPLVLRTNAGSCVRVNLKNQLLDNGRVSTGTYKYSGSTSVSLKPSSRVGLHAELLSYDVAKNDGSNVGFNSGTQTADIDEDVSYEWYAGMWHPVNGATPVEFGSVVLSSPDPLEQYVAGLFGALIVEPEGSYWEEDQNSHSSANVYGADSTLLFREFVLQFQDNLNIASVPSENVASGYVAVTNAINYKSEPMESRFAKATNTADASNFNFNQVDVSTSTSNVMKSGQYPETPHLVAGKGDPVRLRVLHAGGSGTGEIFELFGHSWQEEPYINESTELGDNEASQQFGVRDQLGALNSFDLLVNSAGGSNEVTGDYLYKSFSNSTLKAGVWGIMTVTEGSDLLYVTSASITESKGLVINGGATVNPTTGKMPTRISIKSGAFNLDIPVSKDGTWSFELDKRSGKKVKKAKNIAFTSSEGGSLQMKFSDLLNGGLDASDIGKPSKVGESRKESEELGRGVKQTRVEGPSVNLK